MAWSGFAILFYAIVLPFVYNTIGHPYETALSQLAKLEPDMWADYGDAPWQYTPPSLFQDTVKPLSSDEFGSFETPPPPPVPVMPQRTKTYGKAGIILPEGYDLDEETIR